MEWANLITAGTYQRWQDEAKEITKSLKQIWTEENIWEDKEKGIKKYKDAKVGDPLPAALNAITHAYLSAKIAQKYGSEVAKMFGDGRELRTKVDPGTDWDVYKDLWNNEVGRRIGMESGFFDDHKLSELIKEAFDNSDFLLTKKDVRIPKGFSYNENTVEDFDGAACGLQGFC